MTGERLHFADVMREAIISIFFDAIALSRIGRNAMNFVA